MASIINVTQEQHDQIEAAWKICAPLNQTEIIRLEAVIENEAKCLASGTSFSEYDLEQEGRWIMGCGSFHAGYLRTAASGEV